MRRDSFSCRANSKPNLNAKAQRTQRIAKKTDRIDQTLSVIRLAFGIHTEIYDYHFMASFCAPLRPLRLCVEVRFRGLLKARIHHASDAGRRCLVDRARL